MRKKSVGIFMLVIIIGVAGYVLFPHISSMGETSKKRNDETFEKKHFSRAQ